MKNEVGSERGVCPACARRSRANRRIITGVAAYGIGFALAWATRARMDSGPAWLAMGLLFYGVIVTISGIVLRVKTWRSARD